MLCSIFVLVTLSLAAIPPALPLTITTNANQFHLAKLPTPALVLDLDRYCRNCVTRTVTLSFLRQRYIERGWDKTDFEGALFVHTSVVDVSDALPTLDYRTGVASAADSFYLALGLNNHYVGGYYWARSCIGMGSAMEAPGIYFDEKTGRLSWSETQSNDGKRSEWVEFLKVGDQVQLGMRTKKLLPELLSSMGKGNSLEMSVVSARDVPKGAEPLVIGSFSTLAPQRL